MTFRIVYLVIDQHLANGRFWKGDQTRIDIKPIGVHSESAGLAEFALVCVDVVTGIPRNSVGCPSERRDIG